jgi:hypothetical protein
MSNACDAATGLVPVFASMASTCVKNIRTIDAY